MGLCEEEVDLSVGRQKLYLELVESLNLHREHPQTKTHHIKSGKQA